MVEGGLGGDQVCMNEAIEYKPDIYTYILQLQQGHKYTDRDDKYVLLYSFKLNGGIFESLTNRKTHTNYTNKRTTERGVDGHKNVISKYTKHL